jgi:NitT/TauT family transport system substrate-binding protein
MLSFTTEVCAEKIRTAIPQANLNYLSIYVAESGGFFRDEGLENEAVVISGPLATAALLSGDVDFSGGGGSGMRAALKGAPVKGIYFQTEKVTFYLIADPSIKTAADLKGKKVAIGSSGDTQDRMITMFAERGGVSSRDITRIAMGSDTNSRILALKSGAAHASAVDPGGLVFAQKRGFRELPTAEGIRNFLEYDIKIPLQIREDVPPERLLYLQLVEEVKKELEAVQRRPSR